MLNYGNDAHLVTPFRDGNLGQGAPAWMLLPVFALVLAPMLVPATVALAVAYDSPRAERWLKPTMYASAAGALLLGYVFRKRG